MASVFRERIPVKFPEYRIIGACRYLQKFIINNFAGQGSGTQYANTTGRV